MKYTAMVGSAAIIGIGETEVNDQTLIGAKAYNLARLMPVLPQSIPACFAVSSIFLAEIFGDQGQEADSYVNFGNMRHALATQIAPWLCETKLYAVRSSSVVEDGRVNSYAGLFDTFLGVAATDVAERIHNCATSAFCKMRAQGISNRQFSVMVQEMVPASTAGVAFSKNPVTRADEIVINSVFGLSDHMVDGRQSADTFYVFEGGSKSALRAKTSMRILERAGIRRVFLPRALRDVPTLSTADIGKISTTVKKIAAHLDTPVDVEWAISKERLYVLQARPITQALTCST